VLADGTYVKAVNDKLIYGGMLGIRANIPLQSSESLACAVTIAIRYSCVRRQSELKPKYDLVILSSTCLTLILISMIMWPSLKAELQIFLFGFKRMYL